MSALGLLPSVGGNIREDWRNGNSVTLRESCLHPLASIAITPENQNPPRLLRRVVESWNYCFLVLHPPQIDPHALSLCGCAQHNRDRNREGELHKPMAESNGVQRLESTIVVIKCFNADIRYEFLCTAKHIYAIANAASSMCAGALNEVDSGLVRSCERLEGAFPLDDPAP